MNHEREARKRTPRMMIQAEQRARVMVEHTEGPADGTKRTGWSVCIQPPANQRALASAAEIFLPGNRSVAVRTGAAIAAAIYQIGGCPSQLMVRNKKTGRWGEERTYPDVTPRHRS